MTEYVDIWGDQKIDIGLLENKIGKHICILQSIIISQKLRGK